MPSTDDSLPPRSTPAVSALIATLVAAVVVRYGLVGDAVLLRSLGFSADAFPARWWTPLTHPIAGGRPLALAVDLLALWAFGPRLEQAWGTRRFVRFLAVCALGAALLHFLLGLTAPLAGATALAFGVMLAHLWQWRDDAVWLFGVTPVAPRPLVLALTTATLFASIGGVSAMMGTADPTPIAHLGGFAAAFLYLRMPQRERIEQLRQRVSPVPDVATDEISRPIPRTPPRQRERPEEVDEIVARSKAAVAKRPPAPRVRRIVPAPVPPTAEELDRVLDKISAEGMDSLTEAEREVLERNARRLKEG